MHGPQAIEGIGIEVLGRDPVADAGGLALALLHGHIPVGPEDPQRLSVIELAARDDRAADREERQPRDPEPVRPRRPRPRLVDDRLADIEHDRLQCHEWSLAR